MAQPIENLREKLLQKGENSVLVLGRIFREMAIKDKRRDVSFEDFQSGLASYEIELEKEEAQAVYEAIDKDKITVPEARKKAIVDTFKKVDKGGDGEITVEDLKGHYNAKMHPMVRRKIWTEEQAQLRCLQMFENPKETDGKVTLEDFLNFYTNVSASMENDEDFFEMLNNVWKTL